MPVSSDTRAIIEKLIEVNERNAGISVRQVESMDAMRNEMANLSAKIETLNGTMTNGAFGELRTKVNDIFKQQFGTIALLITFSGALVYLILELK